MLPVFDLKLTLVYNLKAELAKYAEKLKQPIISADEYVNMENDGTTGNDITARKLLKQLNHHTQKRQRKKKK